MVKIRLMRMGATKRPYYRVVVADARAPRDGRFIEQIGVYQPLTDPSLIDIKEERALHWLKLGAQPTEQVQNLLAKQGIWERFAAEKGDQGAKPKKRKAGSQSRRAVAETAPPAEPEAAAGAPAAESETG